jgi:single-stranded DNA-binding protein
MIYLHISGNLVRDPETKVSKNGKTYTSALLVAAAGDSDQLVTVMAFDEDLQRLLAGLKRGDSVSAMGTGSFRAYTDKEGQPATGISLMANRIMALAEGKATPREWNRPPRESGYLESLAAAASGPASETQSRRLSSAGPHPPPTIRANIRLIRSATVCFSEVAAMRPKLLRRGDKVWLLSLVS